ncbi:MAG: hypothetical protein ABJB12_24225 [Pseudomonadota bacterium]
MIRLLSLSLAPAVLFALSGCGLMGTVNVEPVAVSTQKPGNVAMYVSVSEHGSPVLGLDKQAFQVYEDGKRLDNEQIKLTLLPTSTAAARHVALLVDMSKSLNADDRKALTEALRPFIAKLREREAVTLYAFDGTKAAHLVADYPLDARAEADEKDTSMDRLLAFSRRDSSSSLYTALMDSSQKLSASLAAEGRPIQSGTVIVVALNPDLAGRVDEGKVRDFVADSPHHYFLLTVGPWATATNISFLGKNGEARAGSVHTLGSPLYDVAKAVADDYFRDYLVSYCSPSRAGTRQVRLEVTTHDAQGKTNKGSYQTDFDATGFGPGCSPQITPHFVIAAKPKPKDAPRVASNSKPAPKAHAPTTAAAPPAAPAAPAASDHNAGVTSAATSEAKPAASASAAPIAEPPSGLGYE